MTIIPCKEATFLISKRQENGISLRERYHLFIHLIVCEFCRRFRKQTDLIVREISGMQSGERLTPDEKRRMQDLLNPT